MTNRPKVQKSEDSLLIEPKSRPRGLTLAAIFNLLEQEGIPFCVLRGYQGFPDEIGSDVDILVPEEVSAGRLSTLFDNNRSGVGARVVRRSGKYFTLLCGQDTDPLELLTFDFVWHCEIESVVYLEGKPVLRNRKKFKNFWIPSTAHEFDFYLASSISKNLLDEKRATRLTELYRHSPEECRAQLLIFWPAKVTDQFCRAAESGNWSPVQQNLQVLHRALAWQFITKKPLGAIQGGLARLAGRVKRFVSPRGFHLVLLGPDGAGKSSVIDKLENTMVGPFAHVHTLGFAPPIYKLWRKGPVNTDTPHALAPRSYGVSVLRAFFWMAYNLSGYVSLRWAKARSTLVLNDRHFVDILVDPVRYRYGGPRWLLKFIWRLMPKPDAIILLNAPPEVLQARKQELTLDETRRQCREYLALVRQQKNGHVIDAAQSRERVMHHVMEIIFARQ